MALLRKIMKRFQSHVAQLTLFSFLPQRPTAKELLKYQFIKKAKKNAYLIDLIDRFKKWKNQKGEESETESENSDS
jgi:hypothetical protein